MVRRRAGTSGRKVGKGTATEIDVHVGSRIRLRRTRLGSTQTDLANALGLTFQQVQKYESGANRVSASRLLEIAKLLEVTVSYFFDEMDRTSTRTSSWKETEDSLRDLRLEKRQIARRETIDLVRAYFQIPDRAVRRRLTSLAKAIAGL